MEQVLAPLGLQDNWTKQPNGVWILRCHDGSNLHWSSTKGTLWCDGPEEARDALRWKVERCLIATPMRAEACRPLMLVCGPSAEACDKLELALRRRRDFDVVRLDQQENGGLAAALELRMTESKAGAFVVTPVAPHELFGKPEGRR